MPEENEGSQGSLFQEEEYSYGGDFLKDIPEADRPILEPYIKKWDAGITRRFQELQGEISTFAPIRDSGIDPDEFEQLTNLYELINTDPKGLIAALTEALGEEVTPPVVPPKAGESTSTEIPAELLTRLNQQDELLKLLAQNTIDDRNLTQQQRENEELDKYLGLLKAEYGDFNEEYVLVKLSQGVDGEEAVKAWHSVIEQYVTKEPTPNAPKVLLGNGAPPMEQRSVKDLSRQETKNLVVEMLANAQRSNNG